MKEGEGRAAECAHSMQEFVEAVRHMRLAQMTYAATSTPDAFTRRTESEAAVDAYLRPLPKPDSKQPEMF